MEKCVIPLEATDAPSVVPEPKEADAPPSPPPIREYLVLCSPDEALLPPGVSVTFTGRAVPSKYEAGEVT